LSYILHSELDKAFDRSKDQVHLLLKDAKYLYEQSKYPNSIALSILSYEELAKLHLIGKHRIAGSDITKSEWKNISTAGTHEKKLTSIYIGAHQELKKMSKDQYDSIVVNERRAGSNIQYKGYERIIKMSSIITKRLAKLNLIKQYCWYLERTNKEFVTISNIYNKNNLKVLAYWLLNVIYLEFLTTLLNNKYPNNWLWTIPAQISQVRHDPYYSTIQKITREIYSQNFEDVSTRVAIMLDTFPKKLEDVAKQNF